MACGSGLHSLIEAAEDVRIGEAEVVGTGGTDNISRLDKGIFVPSFRDLGCGGQPLGATVEPLAREKGVMFIRFEKDRPPEVTEKEGRIQVECLDKIMGEKIVLEPDLLALSVGIVPSRSEALSKILKTPLTKDGFFLEAHPKLRPVEFSVDGVYLCGLAHGPKPISESIAQAAAAAGKACIPLAKGYVMVEPIVSFVDTATCIGCGICENKCPLPGNAAVHLTSAGESRNPSQALPSTSSIIY